MPSKPGRDTISLLWPLADDMEYLLVTTYRQARRAVILLIGSSVLVIGIAMVVLPGPAVLVVPLGLAILGTEFAWARRWLTDIRTRLGGRKQEGTTRLQNEKQE